jgi:hypothetical protein
MKCSAHYALDSWAYGKPLTCCHSASYKWLALPFAPSIINIMSYGTYFLLHQLVNSAIVGSGICLCTCSQGSLLLSDPLTYILSHAIRLMRCRQALDMLRADSQSPYYGSFSFIDPVILLCCACIKAYSQL